MAAATFMAIATSAPELFVNIIGTFLTQSDLGLGTVVGSSLFNTLGVASLGGLAASAVSDQITIYYSHYTTRKSMSYFFKFCLNSILYIYIRWS